MIDMASRNSETEIGAALPGTPVLDETGVPIGSIADQNPRGGYLAIYKGLFFPKVMYIPLTCIAWTDSYGVHLLLRKDDLASVASTDPLTAMAFSA